MIIIIGAVKPVWPGESVAISGSTLTTRMGPALSVLLQRSGSPLESAKCWIPDNHHDCSDSRRMSDEYVD